MTLSGAILSWGPLWITVALFIVGSAGLVWSPVGSLIAWRLASRQNLNGRRYALAGAAYSVFLLFPWFLLIAALLGRRLPDIGIALSYASLYFFWLLGPILFLLHYRTHLSSLAMDYLQGGSYYEYSQPDDWLLVYSTIAVMVLLWIGSAVIFLSTWNRRQEALNINYVLPFSLAWLCLLITLGYSLIVPPG